MTQSAYCISRQFETCGPTRFQMEQHYFVHALSGMMQIASDGKRWTLPAARGALIAGGYPVEISILSPVQAASVLFAPAMMTPRDNLVVFDLSPLCRELVRVCQPWGARDPQDAYARQMFSALGAEITRLAKTPSPCALNIPKDAALARAITLTDKRLEEPLRFEDIALAVGCSTRTLARRFAVEMGMTWQETLRRLRVLRAMELLALSDISVTEVSLSVGYESLSGFNTAFQRVAGMTPSAYRKTLRT